MGGFIRIDTSARFLYPAVSQKKGKPAEPVPGAGLFVAFQPKPAAADVDPMAFQLGFCDAAGVLRMLPAAGNPWGLMRSAGAPPAVIKVGNEKQENPEWAFLQKAPSVLMSEQPYLFCLIAHPSPEQARAMFAHLRAGKGPDGSGAWRVGWKVHELVPQADAKGLSFAAPTAASDYAPSGAEAYGGWTLYRHMPYASLDVVQQQVRKLCVQLARVRYPAGLGKPQTPPYTTNMMEYTGVLDSAVQAALHSFHDHLAAGKAQKVSAVVQHAWDDLLAEAVTTSARTVTHPGVADAATSEALESWAAQGLISPCEHLVPYDKPTGSWAVADLLWRFDALGRVCRALGTPYVPHLGSSHRTIASEGAGQVAASNHKVGRAIDLAAPTLMEPDQEAPVAFEAHRAWGVAKKVKGVVVAWKEELRFLLYIHSSFDPFVPADGGPSLADRLKTEFEKMTAELEKAVQVGQVTLPGAQRVVDDVKQLGSHLEQLARTPGVDGTGTALADAFFRRDVRRFQWQGGQSDGGDEMSSVTAQKDGAANGVQGEVCSFLNLTRIAWHLGLQTIRAHDSYATAKDGSFKLAPAAITKNFAKAAELDRLAEGIEKAATKGMKITVTPPGAPKKKKTKGEPTEPVVPSGPMSYDPSDFDVEAIRTWMTRATDHPDVVPRATPAMEYARAGVDLLINVQVDNGAGRDKQMLFLESRRNTQVKLMHVGDALASTVVREGDRISIATLLDELSRKSVDGADRSLLLRPVFIPQGDDSVDPGECLYILPSLAEVKDLEWWHIELTPDATFHEFADVIGLHAEVLAAPAEPASTQPGPIWQGGQGYRRSSYVWRAPEPANAVPQPLGPPPSTPALPEVKVPSKPSLEKLIP